MEILDEAQIHPRPVHLSHPHPVPSVPPTNGNKSRPTMDEDFLIIGDDDLPPSYVAESKFAARPKESRKMSPPRQDTFFPATHLPNLNAAASPIELAAGNTIDMNAEADADATAAASQQSSFAPIIQNKQVLVPENSIRPPRDAANAVRFPNEGESGSNVTSGDLVSTIMKASTKKRRPPASMVFLSIFVISFLRLAAESMILTSHDARTTKPAYMSSSSVTSTLDSNRAPLAFDTAIQLAAYGASPSPSAVAAASRTLVGFANANAMQNMSKEPVVTPRPLAKAGLPITFSSISNLLATAYHVPAPRAPVHQAPFREPPPAVARTMGPITRSPITRSSFDDSYDAYDAILTAQSTASRMALAATTAVRLPPPRRASPTPPTAAAAPLVAAVSAATRRLQHSRAIGKLLEVHLGKQGTSLERHLHSREVERVAALATDRAARDYALIVADPSPRSAAPHSRVDQIQATGAIPPALPPALPPTHPVASLASSSVGLLPAATGPAALPRWVPPLPPHQYVISPAAQRTTHPTASVLPGPLRTKINTTVEDVRSFRSNRMRLLARPPHPSAWSAPPSATSHRTNASRVEAIGRLAMTALSLVWWPPLPLSTPFHALAPGHDRTPLSLTRPASDTGNAALVLRGGEILLSNVTVNGSLQIACGNVRVVDRLTIRSPLAPILAILDGAAAQRDALAPGSSPYAGAVSVLGQNRSRASFEASDPSPPLQTRVALLGAVNHTRGSASCHAALAPLPAAAQVASWPSRPPGWPLIASSPSPATLDWEGPRSRLALARSQAPIEWWWYYDPALLNATARRSARLNWTAADLADLAAWRACVPYHCLCGLRRCLPAPERSTIATLPSGRPPAGLLSWRGAPHHKALVARHPCTALVKARRNSSGAPACGARRPVKLATRALPSPPARAFLAPPLGALDEDTCAAEARTAAEADARLIAARAAVAARESELGVALQEALSLRKQLERSRAALRRKEAHLSQVEALLGSMAELAREAPRRTTPTRQWPK